MWRVQQNYLFYSDYKVNHLKGKHKNNSFVNFFSINKDPLQQKIFFLPVAPSATASVVEANNSIVLDDESDEGGDAEGVESEGIAATADEDGHIANTFLSAEDGPPIDSTNTLESQETLDVEEESSELECNQVLSAPAQPGEGIKGISPSPLLKAQIKKVIKL